MSWEHSTVVGAAGLHQHLPCLPIWLLLLMFLLFVLVAMSSSWLKSLFWCLRLWLGTTNIGSLIPAICELCSANASRSDAIFAIHQEHPTPCNSSFTPLSFIYHCAGVPQEFGSWNPGAIRSLQSNTRFGSGAKLACRIFCTSTWLCWVRGAGLPSHNDLLGSWSTCSTSCCHYHFHHHD